MTAIFLAAQSGNVDVLRALLEAGVDVNDGGAKGHTPLSAAVRSGNVDAAGKDEILALLQKAVRPRTMR